MLLLLLLLHLLLLHTYMRAGCQQQHVCLYMHGTYLPIRFMQSFSCCIAEEVARKLNSVMATPHGALWRRCYHHML